MKHIILFCLIICLPRIAASQDSINPFTIHQSCNIILQNTDVYYCPVEPPAAYDTRALLCTPSSIIRDSNGIFETDPYYDPITHGTQFRYYNDSLCTSSWGGIWDRIWQRLFTAKRQADGTPSDIIAGGGANDTVSVSVNEDVDFRASGTIKMENGFHVDQGAFFHAYIEPTWGPVVFTDDFNEPSIDTSQWYVANGADAESGGIECLYDSNVVIVNDSQATDGKALDIMLREYTDSCGCPLMYRSWTDSCNGLLDSRDTAPHHSVFSSAMVRACPWPLASRTGALPDTMAYQHMPYGKYEIREKTPHILHHINNWIYGSFEVDMNEVAFNDQQILHPNVHHRIHNGPLLGKFIHGPGSTIYFVSPDANWSKVNQPEYLFINNFSYDVMLAPGHWKDTVVPNPNSPSAGVLDWPTSLKNNADSTDSVTFYYSRLETDTADNVTWHIDPTGHIFSAPYHVIAPYDSLRFTKDYQPYQITLKIKNLPRTFKTLNCHWSAYLNSSGDTGRLYIDTVANDTLNLHRIVDSDLHTNTEAYAYTVNERYFEYEPAAVPFDWQDTAPSSYQYHTFGIELLPNELRFLIDSAVVLRVPDRLIPPNFRQYDLVKNLDRGPMNFYIGELDIDPNQPTWQTEFERATANGWAGCGTYHGLPTAHKLIDYVRVWDIPAGTPIPNFPQ